MKQVRYHNTALNEEEEEIPPLDIRERKFDKISYLIGDSGYWQATWAFILSLFQVVCTFHIFSFVFQVCCLSIVLITYNRD